MLSREIGVGVRDAVTDALDVAGLLAVAAGAFFAAEPFVGLAAFAAAGMVVFAGSALFAWQGRRR